MYLRSRSLTALLSIATVLLGGCLDRPLRPLVPCTVSGVVNEVRVDKIEQIDLLFLVDNSFSMREEQEALIQEIPRLVETLASGDLGLDGSRDFDPVLSIQVGVITSDMGVGGIDVPVQTRCADAMGSTLSGDDGLLIREHRGSNASCSATPITPPFLEFLAEGTQTPAEFAAEVGCIADTGSDGCAFEQQLEAVLKALTPATSTFTFPQRSGDTVLRTTTGHGDGANAGFLRQNSLLAIIVVTDEDDCSTPDVDLFDVANPSARYPVIGHPNLQCFNYRNVQYDVVERYVNGIIDLRPGQEDFTIFATISGVDPAALAANTDIETENGIDVAAVDYVGLLAAPEMAERADGAGTDLVPGCRRPNPDTPNTPSTDNLAYPPRRLVQVAQGLEERGASGVVASICEAVDADNGDYRADFSSAVEAIAARIAASLPSSCLPRDLIRTGDGSVTCEILEVLPVGTTCASQAARGRDAEPVRMEEDREVCRVTQLVPTSDELAAGSDPAGLGWFYDDYTAQVAMDCEDPDRRREIRFTSGAESVPGAKFRLECLSPVVPTGDRADIGSSCESGGQADCDLAGDDLDSLQSQYDRENASLICDDFSNTCQLSCAADADCPGGFVCFEADEGNMGTQSYCISPTCQI